MIFKLFLILAIVLFIGQQLLADLSNDFVHSLGDVPQLKPQSKPPSENGAEEVADHVNYILTAASGTYAGMGPENRPQQHLQIIAILAHLKAANEKPIYFQLGTAKYKKPANDLIAGRRIGLYKLKYRPITAKQALYVKALIYRVLEDKSEIPPTLNSEVPLPDLEYSYAPETLERARRDVELMMEHSVDSAHLPTFDWDTVEMMAASEILSFKQSQLYAGDFIDAKDVVQWVLDGARS